MQSLAQISLETLPESTIGHIFDQLNQVTGSKGITNKADIPVVMKYVCSLASTSRTLYIKAFQLEAIELLLNSLSHKYQMLSAHFAALWNSEGARRWLWSYLHKNGDDKTYQVIQDVYALAVDVSNEAKAAGLNFEFSQGRKGWPSPNPFYYQTQQGFVLYNGTGPSHMATPLGEIKIYGGGLTSGYDTLSVSQLFIKRLNATFVSCGSKEGKILEIQALSDDRIRAISDADVRRIGKENLADKKGTQNLINNTMCGYNSSYNMGAIKGRPLPEVIWPSSRGEERSYELIKRIWEMLEAHRLGKDPIRKEIKIEQESSNSMNVEPLYENISELAAWGVNLVTQLAQQPFFKGKTWLDCPTKLLCLDNYGDARTLELLNNASQKFLTKNTFWSIHTFGCGNNQRSLNGKNLGDGIELWHYDEPNPYDLNTLVAAYQSVLNGLSQHWVKSELKDYPGIVHTQSEEEYTLFVKTQGINREEDVLFRGLAQSLGLSKCLHCSNDWKGHSRDLYLWIKNAAMPEVLAAFNIE